MPAWSCYQSFHYKRRCPIEVARTCIPHLETCSRFTLDIVIYTSEVWTATPQKKVTVFSRSILSFFGALSLLIEVNDPHFSPRCRESLPHWRDKKHPEEVTNSTPAPDVGLEPQNFLQVHLRVTDARSMKPWVFCCFLGGWEMDREMVCRYDPVSLKKSCHTHHEVIMYCSLW